MSGWEGKSLYTASDLGRRSVFVHLSGYLSLFLSVALFGAELTPGDRYTPVERRHWAFQKRAEVAPPKVEEAFVLWQAV